MFRASLCQSSGDRRYKTASGVSLDVLAAVDRAPLTWEKKEPTDDTSIDVYSQQVNSTCFGHHYAHRQETEYIKPRQDTS